jgi:endonuclease-3 related protein
MASRSPLVLRHFLTCLSALAIFKFEMSSLLPLPKSVYPDLPVTKTVSRPTRALPRSQLPILNNYYHSLFDAHGPQHWWPGRTRFEVIVGAILTQNTSWSNVEAAIRNLRCAGLVSPHAIEAIPVAKLARLIRPSGYFRQKAKKLKAFTAFLFSHYSGSLTRMFRAPTRILREQLLAVHGIGPETADSVLLYAGDHPVFVIDAYTRRILERHNLATPKHTYEELRALFESSLPRDSKLFNEFHALIVRTGKDFCRKSAPRCAACPLKHFLPAGFLQ